MIHFQPGNLLQSGCYVTGEYQIVKPQQAEQIPPNIISTLNK